MPGKFAGMGKSVGRVGFLSLASLFKIIRKHWYISIFLIIMLPAIIGSVQEAIATKNPILPALELGKRIVAADVALGDDAQILEDEGVIGLMGIEKPTEGYWVKVEYFWFFFWRVIFRIFSNIWLIFVPLMLIYKIYHKGANISLPAKNFGVALIIFLVYLFVVNCIFVIYGMYTGQLELTLPEGVGEFKQMWLLLVQILPFHGLYSLIQYLIFR